MRLMCGLILLALSAGDLHSQETRLITIAEAIQIALRDNLDLQQSSNQIELGEISVQQSKASFYPNLILSASASRQYSKNFDLQSDEAAGQTSESFNASVFSSLNLFNGFADVATLEQAKLNLDAGKLNFERQQETIIFETVSQFLQAVLNKEIIHIERENLEAQRKQLGRIEEFYKTGNRSQADVLQQRVDIAQSELQVLNAERDYEVSKYQLLIMLGQPATAQIELVTPDIDKLTSLFASQNPAQMADGALTLRSEVAA